MIHMMGVGEIVMLETMTRFAARGALHENLSLLGAQFTRDADWLREVIAARARYMAGGAHG